MASASARPLTRPSASCIGQISQLRLGLSSFELLLCFEEFCFRLALAFNQFLLLQLVDAYFSASLVCGYLTSNSCSRTLTSRSLTSLLSCFMILARRLLLFTTLHLCLNPTWRHPLCLGNICFLLEGCLFEVLIRLFLRNFKIGCDAFVVSQFILFCFNFLAFARSALAFA